MAGSSPALHHQKEQQWRESLQDGFMTVPNGGSAERLSHRISVDGGMCEICHERLGYIVHHKKKLTPININNPDVSLSFSNLQYVCLDCHNREHGKKGKTEMRCAFTEDGDVIPVSPPEKK